MVPLHPVMDGRHLSLPKMFNILTQKFPVSVTIDSEKCYLKTDFKRWITFELVTANQSLAEEQKLAIILPLCLKKLPSSLETAVKACKTFYLGERNVEKTETDSKSKAIYSFLYDSELIYSAFMTQYNIDLACTSMHWYKFRALFKGLNADNKFSEIMYYRNMDLAKIKDMELREKYRKLKKIWSLPDLRSENEKTEDFVQAVESLF